MRNVLPHYLKHFNRALRARLVAWLLLIVQVSAGLIVPMHAAAHGQAGHLQLEAGATVSNNSSSNPFSHLFGHDQGPGCDDWSAAFALDSHSGHGALDTTATLATTTDLVDRLAEPPPATPFLSFRSRAPPRS